jgi:hypothetical protein
MAGNDVALFLDLDNLVIGARESNLNFDVNLILDHIQARTQGRVVLRRAYSGNPRPDPKMMKELGAAGFTMQSAVTLNNFGKNLIDMYMVVEAMETLVDGQQYSHYVLATSDRDFMPLVHALRRRGKHVIGVGLRRTTSDNLSALCDEYIFYEDLLPAPPMSDQQAAALLEQAVNALLVGDEAVRASVVKERMMELSQGQFGRFQYSDTSFTKFLGRYPALISVEKDGTTTYVRRASAPKQEATELYRRYRSALKHQKLRVIPHRQRLAVLKDLVATLQEDPGIEWKELIDKLSVSGEETDASRNVVSAMMVVTRRAGIIRTMKGKSLATAPVLLGVEGPKPFQEAVIRTDAVYLQAIRDLDDPFDLEQVALALYDSPSFVPYLHQVEAWLVSHPLDRNGSHG